jgi:hypothetical protein
MLRAIIAHAIKNATLSLLLLAARRSVTGSSIEWVSLKITSLI